MTAIADLTPAADTVRRRELAAFLRSRRERITPEQVGLPIAGRRRTPGLRLTYRRLAETGSYDDPGLQAFAYP